MQKNLKRPCPLLITCRKAVKVNQIACVCEKGEQLRTTVSSLYLYFVRFTYSLAVELIGSQVLSSHKPFSKPEQIFIKQKPIFVSLCVTLQKLSVKMPSNMNNKL